MLSSFAICLFFILSTLFYPTLVVFCFCLFFWKHFNAFSYLNINFHYFSCLTIFCVLIIFFFYFYLFFTKHNETEKTMIMKNWNVNRADYIYCLGDSYFFNYKFNNFSSSKKFSFSFYFWLSGLVIFFLKIDYHDDIRKDFQRIKFLFSSQFPNLLFDSSMQFFHSTMCILASSWWIIILIQITSNKSLTPLIQNYI